MADSPFDVDRLADKAAAEAGLGGRARFEVAPAASFPGTGRGLVTTFDRSHDMAHAFSEGAGEALGNQAGERATRRVVTEAGFTRFRRADPLQPRLRGAAVNAHLVDVAWLAAHVDDLLVVDCRFRGDRESSLAAYREGHLPGAVHSFWLDLCSADTSVMTLLPDRDRAVNALSRLGVGPDTVVVGYADSANLYAARLWHLLRVQGHTAVRLLDGGLEAWTAAGGALETADVAAQPSPFRPGPALETAIGIDELRDRLGELQLVDTRSPEEFAGAQARAARGGHIPGAVLLPWNELVDDSGRFLDPADLGRRAADAGLDPDAETITYCQGGVRAAHTALALLLAGFDHVRVYDGSWAQWGNDPSLPAVSPAGAR